MARPRAAARTESPVSYGRTAPVVTDRINRLQIAVSNHKNTEPLFGGEPIVLPKSTTNRHFRERRAQPTTTAETIWNTDNDPNVKWRHVDSWQNDSEGAKAHSSSLPHDENVPFDPFQLGSATITAESIDKKIDAYLQKVVQFEKKRRLPRESAGEQLSPRVRTPLSSCLSPNKGRRRSVSFDLADSEEDIRKIHNEKREKRASMYEKKIYVSKRNRRAAVELAPFDVQPSPPPLLQNSDPDEVDDFFDLLVAKSSSSSHGASDWFKNLLEETRDASDGPSARPSRSERIQPPDLSVQQEEATDKYWQPSKPIYYSMESNEMNSQASWAKWVKDNDQVAWAKQNSPPAPTERPNPPSPTTKHAQTKKKSDSTISPKQTGEKVWIPMKKPRSFVLETVRSTGSDESGCSAVEQSVNVTIKSISKCRSPNWRSKGRSRTDHLLRSIGVEETGKEEEVYDVFGIRRDPEAQRYNPERREPEGILGNQLTSSSEQSAFTGIESLSTMGGTTDVECQLKNTNSESKFDYQMTPRGPKNRSPASAYMTNKPSLIDFDISKSTTGSTKSSEETGPKEVVKHDSTKEKKARKNGTKQRTVPPGDESASSIFSDLPSGSLTQSMQNHDASCRCLPDEIKDKKVPQSQQSLEDCTLFSTLGTLGSEAALLQGHASRARPESDQAAKVARTASRPVDEGRTSQLFEIDRVPQKSPSELRGSRQGDCSPYSSCGSPLKVRSYWKNLASLKTLGSFDSDSMVKESWGRWERQRKQPFIDRNPDIADDDDPILCLRSPEPRRLRAYQANKAYYRPGDGESSVATAEWKYKDIMKPRMRASKNETMPRQSNARYLSNAPVPRGPLPLPDDEEKKLRQSDIWMASIPEQKVPVSKKPPELPKPVEESVMYLMGPLMSGDSEEVSVVTDDFTAQDDNASVAAQQSCYTCGGLAFRGWGWFP